MPATVIATITGYSQVKGSVDAETVDASNSTVDSISATDVKLYNTSAGTVNAANYVTLDGAIAATGADIGRANVNGALNVDTGKTVTICDGSGAATVSGTAAIGNGGIVNGNVTITNGGTLTETTVTSVSVTGTNIKLTVDASLAGVTHSFNVIVDKSAWESIVSGLSTNGGIYQNATIMLTDGSNQLNWADVVGVVTINGYAGSGAAGEYYVADIPEPATATLSLLALAGLCVRRPASKGNPFLPYQGTRPPSIGARVLSLCGRAVPHAPDGRVDAHEQCNAWVRRHVAPNLRAAAPPATQHGGVLPNTPQDPEV